MVATDGHRLALATNQAELPDLEEPVRVLIPRKALVAFLRIAEGRNDQMIRCSFTENHLFFAWSEQLLLSRKLSGAFPDYGRVLPHQHDRSVSLERNELQASVERVARFSDSQSRCIVFDISPGQLLVRAEESNVGQSEEAIAVSYEKEPVQIGLSSLYVSEFLARAEYETVRFFFRDGVSAAEWRPETSTEAASYRYVVMPMAIR